MNDSSLDLIPISGNIVRVSPQYTVMVVHFGNEYECYGKKHYENGETPFMYMFGCLCEINSFSESVDMAVANVPLYDRMFDGE